MYELKCPSCGQVVESSFVRVGAVVVCESCEQTYRVATSHVTRRVRAAGGKSGDDGGSSDPLLSEGGGASSGAAAASAPLASAPADDEPVQGEPVNADAEGGAGSGATLRRLASQDADRSAQRAVLLLVGGLGGILAAMALVFWLTTNADLADPPAGGDAAPAEQAGEQPADQSGPDAPAAGDAPDAD